MKEHEKILTSLKEQFENHNVLISEYEKEILPQIESYKWATQPQMHLALLNNELSRLPKGRVYETERESAWVELGYDDQSRIIYESGDGLKKYVLHKEDSIWMYTFKYPYTNNEINRIEYLLIERGYPTIFASYANWVVNRVCMYKFRDERLVEIDSYHLYDRPRQEPQTPNYFITYNELGDVSEIRRKDEPSVTFPDGQDVSVYKKHDYSIKELTDILVSQMKSAIMHELQDHEFDGRTLLLIFISNSFASDNWFPPRFSIVKTTENMVLDGTFYELVKIDSVVAEKPDNERINEASRLLEQELVLQEKHELPLKILVRIAKEIKSWMLECTNAENNELIIFPLSFSEDGYEKVSTILKRVYSAKDIKKMQKIFLDRS